MLHHRFDQKNAILKLMPDGPLTGDDFKRVADKIDPYIKKNGNLKGVIIEADEFPGWSDFSALICHLKFVQDHHTKVERVATVSNDVLLEALPGFAKHFINAKIESFPHEDSKKALDWIKGRQKDPGLAEILEFKGQPIVGLKITEKISLEDIKELEALVEEKLTKFDHLGIYVELEGAFSISWEAFYEDLKYGLSKWSHFKKKAVVSDSRWVGSLTDMASKLVPGIEVRHFEMKEANAAKAWLGLPQGK